jgi:hypothetical protein
MTGWARWRLDAGKGYEVAKSEIDEADLALVSDSLLWREANEQWAEDPQTPGMFVAYKDPSAMVLHSRLLPRMEEVTGLTLLPTYAYARVYRPGAILEKHKDRAACEVSGTLLLAANYSPTWPLFIEGEQVIQEPGELVVYRGCEVEHWREPMTGPDDAFHVQLFLHYVDANGPFTMCAGDEILLWKPS